MQVGGAVGVGGVGGAFGEGADEVVQGVGVALVGQYVTDGVAYPLGDGFGSAGREGASARVSAVREGVEDRVEQRPQGVGAFGA